MIRSIGILTSGGDAPGMNNAIGSVVRACSRHNIDVYGIQRGYNGLLGTADDLRANVKLLDLNTALDMEAMRGTWLRTARCEEFKKPEIRQIAAQNLKELGVDALVVIGGDGSFMGAHYLCELGIPCVGIPGTIDNDLGYTEYTLGYDTAVGVCVDAVRSIRATSRGHDRPHVVEVMGRYCGDIATRTAIATGAEMLVISEMHWDLREVGRRMKELYAKGNTRSTLVIAEHSWEKGNMEDWDWRGYLNDYFTETEKNKKPEDRHRMLYPDEELDSHRIAQVLSVMTGAEVRHTVVGYTQRGATCSSQDGAFAFKAGFRAVDLLNAGKTNRAIGVKNGEVFDMDFSRALAIPKVYDSDLYNLVNDL